MPRSRITLSFWTAAFVVVLTQWGSAAASVTYPLYAQEWDLTPLVTTTIFAIYPVTLVIVLTLFGGISDHIGRRAALLIGVSLLAAGGLALALAPDVVWLYIGRAIQGAGVGLSLGAASASLVDFNSTGNPSRASSVNTLAQSVGLVAATVVGGALIQYAPLPLHLSFWLLFTLILLAIVLITFMPKHDPYDSDGNLKSSGNAWKPRPVGVPNGSRRIFIASAFAGFTGLGVGSIILSLDAQIAKDLIHTDSALIQGLILAISSVFIGVVALAFRRVPPRISVVIGGLTSALAILLFIPSASLHSLPIYLIAQVFAGAALGFSLLGGIGLIHRYAPAHHRGMLISAFYLVAYVGQGLVSTLAGITATGAGLAMTVDVFAPILAVVGVATAIVGSITGRQRTR
ncbi:MFS transporter [Herbiconiux sp. P16]|uniref:MFS transporter n=1 Tax=Herbiconiux wuyangfengii TaxID=3342794 RepID=UPI0035BAB00C